MSDRVTPIIFVGASRAHPLEALLADAQEAVAQDVIDRLARVELFAPPIIATNSPQFAARVAGRVGQIVPDDGDFHFGRQLQTLIERFNVDVPLYLGGGSAPLMAAEDFRTIATLLLSDEGILVANNFFSADFVGFRPGAAIARIEPPRIDNDLAYLLQRQAGLRNVPFPRSAATQMDIDTPTDLAILALHPQTGPILQKFLSERRIDTTRLHAASRFLTDPTAEVIVAGRVGTHVWVHLETDLACRKRIFSEERGMRASGREARGETRSLLGHHLEAVGPTRFFAHLAELGNALFLDSRVLFNHLRLDLPGADRFASDLFDVAAIAHPFVRDFTAAAAEASIPVILGGHSLVAGGLWALIDATWLERDRQIGRIPT